MKENTEHSASSKREELQEHHSAINATISKQIKEASQNFFYPDSNVLKNKYHIKNKQLLMGRCSDDVKKEIIKLRKEPPPEKLNSSYLKYLHQRLFSNTFEWAGQTREEPFTFEDGSVASMPILKRKEFTKPFAVGRKIQEGLEKLDKTLSENNNFQGLSREEFVEHAAEIMINLHHLHPFREGNRRTKRLFVEKLGQAAGHKLDFSIVSKKRKNFVRTAAMERGDSEPMKHLLEDISNPDKFLILQEFTNAMRDLGMGENNYSLVVFAKDGETYHGTYRGCGNKGFMMDVQGTLILGNKKDLTPAQIQTLTVGENFSFTAPNAQSPQRNQQERTERHPQKAMAYWDNDTKTTNTAPLPSSKKLSSSPKPEEKHTLKPIQRLQMENATSFTASSVQHPQEVLIGAKEIAPLTRDQILMRVKNDASLQAKRTEIETLCKIVYGNRHILQEKIEKIHENPTEVGQLAYQIATSARSISKLSGINICGIKNNARANAEANILPLSRAIDSYINIFTQTEREIFRDHHAKQRRCEQAVEMPKVEMKSLLSLPKEQQKEILSNSPKLRGKIARYSKKINERLSSNEYEAIKENNPQKLAKSFGISTAKAKDIIEIVKRIKGIEQDIYPAHFHDYKFNEHSAQNKYQLIMPKVWMKSLLSLPKEKQQEILSNASALRGEITHYIDKINEHLSSSEREAIKENKPRKLAKDLGISTAKAKEIIGIAKCIKEIEQDISSTHFHDYKFNEYSAQNKHQLIKENTEKTCSSILDKEASRTQKMTENIQPRKTQYTKAMNL
ncbi:BID domain-containing T4SS effector [Bartonella tribocorum]|uniref:protein adenylyltransferase n=1 Tax=Bartonella tribocorum TaxID=85701 RepID=A0A2M6URS4_9HYPH|nr:BID domain-containing T4SS effector [Bartonella tribocorum]PIT68881.1 restriction endonuclease [Bartonella tribocorum]